MDRKRYIHLFGYTAFAIAVNNGRGENGNAIFFLFVAIALFGLLAYAFLQGSRSNMAVITGEAQKVSTYQSQDCVNSMNKAVRRLEARGCAGMISLNPDGSNTSSGAPRDGSCSVYHPNGGGAKYCGVVPSVTPGPSCGPSPVVGGACGNGTIYVGMSPDGNTPLFTTPADAATMPWNDGVNGNFFATNISDPMTGRANTEALAAMDANPSEPGMQHFMAAYYCFTLSAHGHSDWYLPAKDEMHMVLANQTQGSLAGTVNGSHYWTSSEDFITAGYYWDVDGNGGGSGMKHFTNMVRCVRKD